MTSDGKETQTIPAAIVGVNHRWPDEGKGVRDSEVGRPADDFAKLSRQVGLDMLRYPGGTVANGFSGTRDVRDVPGLRDTYRMTASTARRRRK